MMPVEVVDIIGALSIPAGLVILVIYLIIRRSTRGRFT